MFRFHAQESRHWPVQVMNTKINHWKVPVALSVIACSLASVVLLYAVNSIDLAGSWWAYKHLPRPWIAEEFLRFYRMGLVLPVLTITVAIWFLGGKSVTANRLAWIAFLLVLLHLFWLSWGVLAFYLANQTFVMH